MRGRMSCLLVVALVVLVSNRSFAGAVLEINEEASIDLGFRLQALGIVTEGDRDGDGDLESVTDFKTRRARVRLKGNVTDRVTAFMQTEVGSGAGGSGHDMRVIDAWVSLKADSLLTIFGGQHMAAASRQNVTGSAALMAMDRPGMNYKTLTWGTRSVSAFANNTFSDSDAGLRGEVDVRDTGMTLFGSGSVSDGVHFKYYGGVYDGVQLAGCDEPRLTGRVQVNLMDSEPGYFNSSTYLGKKKTVGIGASVDRQDNVANSLDRGKVDYEFHTVDLFAECPVGPGSVSFETAYEQLDLGDATALDHDGDALTPERDATRSQGDGYYVQAGYLLDKWQPWASFESWDSDAADGKGSYDIMRAGITYYIKGQNANVKLGFERLDADCNIAASQQDRIESVVLGIYVNY